jgi:hypothetical protein
MPKRDRRHLSPITSIIEELRLHFTLPELDILKKRLQAPEEHGHGMSATQNAKDSAKRFHAQLLPPSRAHQDQD